MFENDRRFLSATTYDTEWDPYMDDSIALVGPALPWEAAKGNGKHMRY